MLTYFTKLNPTKVKAIIDLPCEFLESGWWFRDKHRNGSCMPEENKNNNRKKKLSLFVYSYRQTKQNELKKKNKNKTKKKKKNQRPTSVDTLLRVVQIYW